jgi:predicted membrane-bound spermidine synthase
MVKTVDATKGLAPGSRSTIRRGLPASALGTLFFLSGALALLYEIVWFRRLHLTLGVGIFAVGAVVSAFMLGLAVGSGWASRSRWLRRAPLAAYAAFEIGIALYAIGFPLLVRGMEALYPMLFESLAGRSGALGVVRFLLAFAALLPPTFLMGASLPAIAEAAALAADGDLSHKVVRLYAVNTLGGVFGTLVTGFLLLERLGLTRSLYLGAAGSTLVAVAALALTRHPACRAGEPRSAEADPQRGRQQKTRSVEPAAGRSPHAPLALAAAATAGLVSLAAELVWTRALVFFVHNSTYAFSAILAVYLLGIAGGAVLVTRFGRAPAQAVRLLAVALAAASVSLLCAIAVYRHLPALGALLAGGQRMAVGIPGSASSVLVWSWSSALVMIFGQVAAVLFVPAVLLGAVFPLTLKLAEAESRPAAELVGRLYAVNTVGSVAGAVLGTFALVAFLGTRGALLLLAWLPVPIALWAITKATPTRARATAFAGSLLVVLAIGSLVAAPRGFYERLFAERFGRVVWFSEGVSETVAVCEHPDRSRWIQFSDGRGASGTWSFQGGWLYAHLPLLLHPHPESAVVVCFGTGNTLGAASLHPLRALDGIELSPEVVKAAHVFASTNHDVGHNDRVRLVIEDGRSYMLATDRRYDVISEEPPLVHTAGVVNLYSRDFYELCARRLNDDGIMAVWLATWELETEELRRLVKAFLDVFPYASAWDCTHPYEWVLIGSKRPLKVDLEQLTRRMAEPRLAHDLARIEPEYGGIRTPAELLSLHLEGRAALEAFAGSIAPVTDDRSVVDFTTPRHARAGFGLGEWVTGGLATFAVGSGGLRTETRIRDFDRIYAFREPAAVVISSYGGRDPAHFAAELRERVWIREMRAGQRTLGDLRRVASELRSRGEVAKALATLEHGTGLVPWEASGPLYGMIAVLHRELGRPEQARAAEAEAGRIAVALQERLARTAKVDAARGQHGGAPAAAGPVATGSR